MGQQDVTPAVATNRVAAKIQVLRDRIASGEVTEDARAKCDAGMAIDFEEHFAFQQAQARAHVEGLLATDEAQIVYMALGEVGSTRNGGWSEGTDTATKVVVTTLVAELLQRRIEGRQ